MIEILDGPAAGAVLSLRSAPHFLRVVVDASGKVDALDQPADVPEDGETIHVYVVDPASLSVVYIRPGGRYAMGRYRHLPVDTTGFANRARWVEWVRGSGNACAENAGLPPWEEPT